VAGAPPEGASAAPMAEGPVTQEKRARSTRDNNFDLLRLLAALAVLVEHAIPPSGTFLLGRAWFFDGVVVFFVISGFLVYRSAASCLAAGRPWSHYFLSRFLRIGPALYAYAVATVGLLLVFGVVAPGQLWTPAVGVWFLSHLLFVPRQGFPGIGSINFALWTIPIEVTFYAIVPMLVMVAGRWGTRTLLVTVAIGSVIGLVLGIDTHSATLVLGATFIPYFCFFGLGIAWSQFAPRLPNSAWPAAACVVVYIALRYTVGWQGGTAELTPWTMAWAAPLSYVVVWVALRAPTGVGRIVTRAGDVSYGVYLWHCVVIVLTIHLATRLGPAGYPVIVAAVTLVIAYLSWRLVEAPALRFKKFSTAPAARLAPVGLPGPAARGASRR
jgi:peptidoglycan/LPS O-acetylase OafA/YrhL